ILDEAFNGTANELRQQRSSNFSGFGGGRGGGMPFFGPFAAPGAATPNNPSQNRIRVVADPATNSLLVKASPIDMLSIRRLLDKAIDAEDTDSRALTRSELVAGS